jgi:hypothetical protein
MRTLRGDASHGPRTVGGSHRTAIPHSQGTMATTIFGSHELSVPRQIGNGFKVSSETGPSAGARRFHPSIVSSRPRNRFAARKFDEPPLTAE